jgi:PiT family inorganic phosphate transporter
VLFAVVALAVVFGLVNGIHDAGNAIAAPIVTNALRPGPAVVLAAVFHVIGALVVGTAVAATVAGIIDVPTDQILVVLGAAVTGALVWNLATLWWGLPCSSGHCLVGSLAGAALVEGGVHAVHWGGLDGIRPEGVVGSLLWLLVSTLVAVPFAVVTIRLARRVLRRARRSVERPVKRGEIATTAALAFAHGSNDAQKTMGLVTLALVGGGRLSHFAVPLWVELLAAAALTLGTSLGGWRVVRTLGRHITHLRPLDGLAGQGSSSVIVLAASLAGAPISTTDVVAPAIVGVGTGERWRRVRWRVVREIGLAWLVTLPVAAVLAALAFPVWRWLA